MSLSSSQVHQKFCESFKTSITSALVRCAVQAHEVSRRLVADYPQAQAHDVLPYLRRAEFEMRASGIVVPGITVETKRNKSRTSSYVEISNDGAVLTALTRSKAPRKLPKAYYRKTKAAASQMTIFEILGDIPVEDEGRIYGCFVYGNIGKETDPGVLSLARVYFPLPNLPLHTIRPLDLLVQHATILETERANAEAMRPSEEVLDIAIKLKKKFKDTEA